MRLRGRGEKREKGEKREIGGVAPCYRLLACSFEE